MDLPLGNEPLQLADGTLIDCETGRVKKDTASNFISVPSSSEAQKIIARTRRTVADLPLPPKNLSGVALVAFYTLFGLGDQEIAIALDNVLTLDQIKNIRKLEPYIDFMSAAKENILNTEHDTVREVFAKNAEAAALKLIQHANSDNDVLSFTASKDVLDRAGHRPADIVEHRHKIEDALNIVIIKKDETKDNDIPMIDVTPETFDG